MKKKLPQLFSNKNDNNNRVPSRFGKKDKVDKKLKSNNLFGKFGNKNNKDNRHCICTRHRILANKCKRKNRNNQ